MASEPPAPSDDDLITRAHIAQLYGVKEPTVSSWLYRGDPRLPPPIRIGRNYLRWRRGDVIARMRAIAAGNLLVIAKR